MGILLFLLFVWAGLFHFISFYFILFHFISFYFILFHFISFYFILFHFISFYFILFRFILFYFMYYYYPYLSNIFILLFIFSPPPSPFSPLLPPPGLRRLPLPKNWKRGRTMQNGVLYALLGSIYSSKLSWLFWYYSWDFTLFS